MVRAAAASDPPSRARLYGLAKANLRYDGLSGKAPSPAGGAVTGGRGLMVPGSGGGVTRAG